jgi:hypothetical protein
MQQTSGMAGTDGLPWEAVARAAAALRKRGYIDWDYDKWPNELEEPPSQQLDYMTFQRTKNITVTGAGYQALEGRKAKPAATQINIVNSIVGQVALRDINNIDVFVILKAAEASTRAAIALPSAFRGGRTAAAQYVERIDARKRLRVAIAASKIMPLRAGAGRPIGRLAELELSRAVSRIPSMGCRRAGAVVSFGRLSRGRAPLAGAAGRRAAPA